MSYHLPTHCPNKPSNISNNHPRSYNLNINAYTFNELLGLFDLTQEISIDDLKRAKQKVLKTHPDKSKLPPDYFIFYKKAYELILDYYKSKYDTKQTQQVPATPIQYKPVYNTDKQTSSQISSQVNNMEKNVFQTEFNRLYEQHMASQPNTQKNQWFSEDKPVYQYNGQVSSGNMANVFQTMKTQQQQMGMVKYNGVREMNSAGNIVSSNFYDDINTNDDDAEDVYVSSDPFSKLKFEDLRKVHKDQTIFSVGEQDFNRVQTYASVDQYQQQRSAQPLTPMEKQQAEMMLAQQEREYNERMARKQQESMMRILENEEKNKVIRARFLQLENKYR